MQKYIKDLTIGLMVFVALAAVAFAVVVAFYVLLWLLATKTLFVILVLGLGCCWGIGRHLRESRGNYWW